MKQLTLANESTSDKDRAMQMLAELVRQGVTFDARESGCPGDRVLIIEFTGGY